MEDLNQMIDDLGEQLGEVANSDLVVGSPIELGPVTIVPLSEVGVGFGGGGGGGEDAGNKKGERKTKKRNKCLGFVGCFHLACLLFLLNENLYFQYQRPPARLRGMGKAPRTGPGSAC